MELVGAISTILGSSFMKNYCSCKFELDGDTINLLLDSSLKFYIRDNKEVKLIGVSEFNSIVQDVLKGKLDFSNISVYGTAEIDTGFCDFVFDLDTSNVSIRNGFWCVFSRNFFYLCDRIFVANTNIVVKSSIVEEDKVKFKIVSAGGNTTEGVLDGNNDCWYDGAYFLLLDLKTNSISEITCDDNVDEFEFKDLREVTADDKFICNKIDINTQHHNLFREYLGVVMFNKLLLLA